MKYTIEVVLVRHTNNGSRRVANRVVDDQIEAPTEKEAQDWFSKRVMEMIDK